MKILDNSNIPVTAHAPVQPRALGAVSVSVKRDDGVSRLAGLRQSGSLKLLFPRTFGDDQCLGVLVNTAGGITGGDHFTTTAEAGAGTTLCLTTQAAERAYRASPGQTGQVRTTLTVRDGARLNWLPQETLIFDGSALDRRLDVDLAADACALIVEPLVFGRAAMGETVRQAHLTDRIEISRNGAMLVLDQIRLTGDVAHHMAHPATGDGAVAVANVLYIDPAAEARLPHIRAMLPSCGAASLRAPDVLALRLIAADSYAMRKTLVPILTALSGTEIPRPWMI